MRSLRLYRFFLVSVLLTFGCGGKDSADSAEERAAVIEEHAATQSEPGTAAVAGGGSGTASILFLGDSITAGYGLDPDDAFPTLIEQKIDSLGWDFAVVNGGLSGETSAGGLRRVEWLLQEPADVLVLELGGNDGLRGVPPESTKENLKGIIQKARAVNPGMEIILAGMQVPPNLGSSYTERFRSIYPEVAEEEDVHLITFVLEGVGGISSLNQADGIHPTAEGHRVVAETVWSVLRPVLESLREDAAEPVEQ